MQLKEEVTLELEAVGSGTRECRSVRGAGLMTLLLCI